MYGYGGPQKLWHVLDNFLGQVQPSNLHFLLQEIPSYQLNMLSEPELQSYIQLIIAKAIDDSISPAQGLYLCVVLSSIPLFRSLQLPDSEKVHHAFDNLLHCVLKLGNYRYFNIPQYFRDLIDQICCKMVANSSYPTGWLTLAAFFYPFLTMQRLMDSQHNMPSTNYDEKTFHQLLHLLLPNIEKVNNRNEFSLRKFLKRVLQYLPDEKLLFELCEDKGMRKFFNRLQDRQKFFTECYLDHLRSNEHSTYYADEIFKKLLIIPENLRSLNWSQIFEYLLKFAESKEKASNECVTDFISLFLSICVPKELVCQLLEILSKSTLDSHQNILKELLRIPEFDKKWKSISFQSKVSIGQVWLMTKLRAILDNSDRGIVVTSYLILKELTSCSLVCKLTNIKSELFDFVYKWLLENVDPGNIIIEIGKIHDSVEIPRRFQESIFKLLKHILESDINLINRKEVLDLFSCSR